VALRRDQHLLEELAVSLLDPTPARNLGLGGAKPRGERVAHALEVGDAENPGAAAHANPPLDPLPGKSGCEQLTEMPLEQRDLAPKLGANSAVGECAFVDAQSWRRLRR
jgi:hypothetical protein